MEDALGMKIILNQRKIVRDAVVSLDLLSLMLFEDNAINAAITGGQHAICLLSCRMSL